MQIFLDTPGHRVSQCRKMLEPIFSAFFMCQDTYLPQWAKKSDIKVAFNLKDEEMRI